MKKAQIPAIGIDLGGTKISAALVSNKAIIGAPLKVSTPKGAENISAEILHLIQELQKDNLVIGVGVATAGIVNPESGSVIGSTGNLPGWEGTELKKIIQTKTALHAHVENDANAAAYGEYRAANLAGKKCTICITLGTGIGTGIIIDGKIYRGAHFAAGECGHIKISMDNRRLCTCGLWDCWEAYGSGRGFLTTGMETLRHIQPEQSKLATLKDNLTNQDIIEAHQCGDPIAARILYIWHEHVAAGMVSLAHTLDPDCFIITGGMSKFVNYQLLKEMVTDRVLPRIAEKLEIHASILGEAAGTVGAAHLVLDSITDFGSLELSEV